MASDRYQRTTVWNNAFASRPGDKHAAERSRLRTAFELFRGRAAQLASKIPRDLPDFTVHDVGHLDALWEMIDLVAGPKYSLTPAEAFVLGGAVLTHDLAMSRAAFDRELATLKSEPLWRDTVASATRAARGDDRPISAEDIASPTPEIEREAVRTLLRVLHARQAEALPTKEWGYAGTRYHLLEDADLREALAGDIGKVAHSHHWPVEDLLDPTKLHQQPNSGPGLLPPEWTIDLVKLACLLRTADVCQADDRRAPGFLAALRQPGGVSDEHWKFQKFFRPAYRDKDDDRIRYRSSRPFPTDDVDAWWQGYDWLRLVDRELRAVDALLADTKRPRLAAKGVWNIDDPTRLAHDIQTDGWEPVDARIKVGDVARVVRMLGGEQLYGQSPEVPFRELMQNAADAIRARRRLTERQEEYGTITVCLGADDAGEWVEVRDDGIGMSPRVLTGPLLDFGTAFWGSDRMRAEFPGLEAAGMRATGQFGIGFYSAFMWGDHIRLISRRYDRGYADARVLEFRAGAGVRPILRVATRDEQRELPDGGTVVRVWIDPKREVWDRFRRLVPTGKGELRNLAGFLAWLAPALDVNVSAEAGSKTKAAVKASDWLTLPMDKLVERLGSAWGLSAPWVLEKAEASRWRGLTDTLEMIRDQNGRPIGRGSAWAARNGQVTVGGFRTDRSGFMWTGLYLGRATRAARDESELIASKAELHTWAVGQSALDDSRRFSLVSRLEAARACAHHHLGELPICYAQCGGLSVARLRDWAANRSSIRLYLSESTDLGPDHTTLNENDLFTNCHSEHEETIEKILLEHPGPLLERTMSIICEAWAAQAHIVASTATLEQWIEHERRRFYPCGSIITLHRPKVVKPRTPAPSRPMPRGR